MYIHIYRIYSRNSPTFLTKILYLNLGCVIYARKRFYVGWGCYVERGKFNAILGVNALLPVHSPRTFKQACTNISLSVAERE